MQPPFGIQPCSLLSALHRSDLSLPNCENDLSKAQSCSHLQTFLGGPAGIESPSQHLGDALQPAQAWQYLAVPPLWEVPAPAGSGQPSGVGVCWDGGPFPGHPAPR